MSHLRRELDQVIHSPVRFSIVAALTSVERAEFGYIRDMVEISDSSLSQHVTTLEKAGYLKVVKTQAGRRAKTWIGLTPQGRAAFRNHVAVLNRIAEAAPTEPAGDGGGTDPEDGGRPSR
ncbi:winged helix-turn-helix domain-containing protein [Actinorugispora endophytica]|uniref:Transcriptional regulator n=1 Tax=Actinorugispora endophytica TaxID=1605990 RepID=A0A4R6V9G3_9ACTN|nr:transcriptional regulator [Actinorugispora endophytica]TDQ53098.1 transcriptional regulator [Actinorugispora endophytica]